MTENTPKERDIEGLTAILGDCLVTFESNMDGMAFNYHQGHGPPSMQPQARYAGEFDAIILGSNSDSFYDMEIHAEALYDRLEAFFAEAHGRRIHALLEQVTDHERRYVEHLFGPDGAK
ncbi:hypothetical protein HOU03_gp281 [Caulobacter phage CcrSC]|uniref:Uncharacterized protein n=1 Tax=Caulobacter phage CcrSC TaxID=2283272 RepID=A0A385EGF6_9CAUD|nr:hypothetical protein HOU03_gp281 [Caulobacter phage CcrSC]AXQ69987.1 hypothetical protein CcrSC_gp405 [Caulobacter phage CcrSC]